MYLNRIFNFIVVLALVVGIFATPLAALAQEPASETAPPLQARSEKELQIAEEEMAALNAPYYGPQATWPGPDGFGYAGAMCAYNWVDISGTGTALYLSDDQASGPYPVGFTFPLYDSTWTEFYVTSNGHIDFGAGLSALTNQCPLPNDSTPNNVIGVMWDDLDPGDTNDAVYYESFASCPVGSGQCLVVQYENYHHYSSTPPGPIAGTFEAILYDDGTVIIQFEDAGAEEGSGSTTGIEGFNAAADYGLTYACDTATSLSDNLCLQFVQAQVPLLTGYKQAPSSAMPTDLLDYTLVLQNVGPQDATSAWMEDPIPAGTTYVPASVSCSSGSCAYNSGADQVEWNGVVSSTESVTVTFQVDPAGAACGTPVTNTAIFSDPAALGPAILNAYTEIWAFIPFATDLEADNGGFSGTGEWEWGTPTYPAGLTAHSGTKVWGTDLDGDVDDTIPSHALTRMISVPDFPNVPLVLTWWDWNGAEAADYIRVAIDGTVVYEEYDYDQRAWTMHSVDLTPWRGETVELMFELEACCSNPGPDGWYIDDISILTCEPPADLYLSPQAIDVSGCVGITQTHNLNLANWTGSNGTFNLTYGVTEPGWATLVGPSSLDIDQGASESFVVTLTPEVCLPNNTVILGTVAASGNGYTKTSTITKTVSSGTIFEWQSAANTPLGTRYHAAAYYDGALYQIGGETGWWVPVSTVNKYDMDTNTWSAAASLPVAAYGLDAVEIGGLIYVPGGSDDTDDTYDGGTFLSTLYIYDPGTNSWSTGAAMPAARAYASAVAYGGKLYVIGGEDNTGAYVDTLYIYDPGTNSWSTGASMAQARGYAAAAAIGGKIYVAGGFVGGTLTLDTMEVYDIGTDTWTAGPDAPKVAAFYGDGTFANRYFIAYNGDAVDQSAGSTSYSCSQDAYWYDTVGGAWTTLPLLNRCLYGSQGAGDDLNFYLISGRTNEGGVWAMSPAVEYMTSCPTCTEVGWLEGNVYDYDGLNPPCTPTTVELQPGGQQIAVDVSGYYTAAVVPFDYAATATADDYPLPDGPYPVTVNLGAATTQDFLLDRADIEVDPQALSAALVAPQSTTEYFTITNLGTYSLYYELQQVAPGAITVSTVEPEATGPEGARNKPEGDFKWLEGEVQIDPQIYAELDSQGATDFFVQLRTQADLSGAEEISDWNARGTFVYNALRQAAKTQAPIIAYAQAHDLAYETRLSNNAVFIKGGGLADVDALAALADVYQIRANHVYELEESSLEADIEAWGWNLDELDPNNNLWGMEAAQVWDQLGVFGEGIVVANIDTGALYTHEALDRQYRGNLSGAIGGPYDHNFNWYQPTSGCPTADEPCDNNGHGSGTMGIMVGETQDLVEQVGIAPMAQWIACKGCETTGCSDAALTGCADWMVAPCPIGVAPGDPSCNPAMRPNVVNNSWGGTGCDLWYQGYIQAWVAAGIFPAFSAGNTVACSAVGAPGDTPEAFGTAAHGTDGTNVYAGGPSCHFPNPSCDPNAHQVDPHLSSPTFGRTSGNTQGAYYNLSGTSGASPHTAGCVALMWSANPGMVGDIEGTMTVLEQTADRTSTQAWNEGDCGKPACAGADPYPNYEYGWGYLDCFAAVDEVFAPNLGWVSTDPVSGTLPTGDQLVEVTFTCSVTETQLPQPVLGTLRVQHNDPCEAPVDVSLELWCISQNPIPRWEKEVWVNGTLVEPIQGPHVVRPGDTVTIVDRVAATFSETVTATLTEEWSDSLILSNYDAGGVGTVSQGANVLTWDLTGVAPNTFYPITKTFDVAYGDWTVDVLTETFRVEDAVEQLPPIVVAFEHYVPALALVKDGPAMAYDGETISLTLSIFSDGNFRGDAVLSDTLPVGMAYAGNLTWTYGLAWEDAGTVYWTSYTTTPPLASPTQIEVLILTPDVGSGGGDVSHLVTALNGCTDVNTTVWDPDTNGNPSVVDLMGYQVVVLGNDILWNNMDKVTVGNNLADYIDAGGKVIEGLYVQSFDDWGFGGRYMTGGYSPFTTASLDNWNPDTINILDPASPIVAGVSSAGDNWGHQNPGLRAGADLPTDWTTSNYNHIAVNENVVAFNQLLHHQAAWVDDVPLLLCNSVAHLMGGAAPPMPAKVVVTFDATVSGNPGEVIHNEARLDWGVDFTTDVHDVTIGGCTEVVSLPITMLNTYPVYPGDEIVFSADMQPDGMSMPYNYAIDFGDGTPLVVGSLSLDPMPFTHTYTAAGDYMVELFIWNCGMSQSQAMTDTLPLTISPPFQYYYLPMIFKGF